LVRADRHLIVAAPPHHRPTHVSQCIMAIPMYLLYEGGPRHGRILQRMSARKPAEKSPGPDRYLLPRGGVSSDARNAPPAARRPRARPMSHVIDTAVAVPPRGQNRFSASTRHRGPCSSRRCGNGQPILMGHPDSLNDGDGRPTAASAIRQRPPARSTDSISPAATCQLAAAGSPTVDRSAARGAGGRGRVHHDRQSMLASRQQQVFLYPSSSPPRSRMLKPNISAIVARSTEAAPRRDAGFPFFYMRKSTGSAWARHSYRRCHRFGGHWGFAAPIDRA